MKVLPWLWIALGVIAVAIGATMFRYTPLSSGSGGYALWDRWQHRACFPGIVPNSFFCSLGVIPGGPPFADSDIANPAAGSALAKAKAEGSSNARIWEWINTETARLKAEGNSDSQVRDLFLKKN